MTNDLPSRYINKDSWKTVKEVHLADPDFNKPTQSDLIIEAGHYEDLVAGKTNSKNQESLLFIDSQYSGG